KFENNRDATFLDDEKTGRVYLAIEDGAFDYFDEVCHACSPFPVAYLRIDRDTLVDISSEHRDEYDFIVRDAQKDLSADQRRQFKELKERPSDRDDALTKTRYRVLTVVFAYLYSGREEQAHQALREVWPPFDQERIWAAIIEQRRNGILCYTRKDAVCGADSVAER